MSINSEKQGLLSNQTNLLILYNNFKPQTQILLNKIILDNDCKIALEEPYSTNVNELNNKLHENYDKLEGIWKSIEQRILFYNDDTNKTIARYQALNNQIESAINEITSLVNNLNLQNIEEIDNIVQEPVKQIISQTIKKK